MDELFFNYNGKFYKDGEPVISPGNKSLRYGDGLFDTIKMVKRNLLLKEYHFQRLFRGMQVLSFDIPVKFNADFLEKKILELAEKNNHCNTTRVRIMILRGDGNLFEQQNHIPNYVIQTWDIQVNDTLNNKGLIIDIYPLAKKSCDPLANLKSNNFLAYSLAAMHAKLNNLDDCILLNTNDRIADTTIANIFIIKNGLIFTPSLNEGCIAGVMRRWIIEISATTGNPVKEMPLSMENIKEADEVFLTNSIYPIRWVKQIGDVLYRNSQVQIIYDQLLKTF